MLFYKFALALKQLMATNTHILLKIYCLSTQMIKDITNSR